MTLNFRRVYLWHLSNARWEKAVEKYDTIVDTIKNVHERFLKKRYNKSIGKRRSRPGFIRNWFYN